MLWNKSIRWILLPFTLIYLALVGTSLVRFPSDSSLTCTALSIVDIYGNGWAHKQTFPTLSVSLAYNWMWLGGECPSGASAALGRHLIKPCDSEHYPHCAGRRETALDESPGQAICQFNSLKAVYFYRRYGVGGCVFSSEVHTPHFLHRSVESGFPLTMVEAIYCAVGTKNPVALTAVYPLLMQVVVGCAHFIDGRSLRRFLSGNQSRADYLAGRQKPFIPRRRHQPRPRHGARTTEESARKATAWHIEDVLARVQEPNPHGPRLRHRSRSNKLCRRCQ
jgi:hypothetical protein